MSAARSCIILRITVSIVALAEAGGVAVTTVPSKEDTMLEAIQHGYPAPSCYDAGQVSNICPSSDLVAPQASGDKEDTMFLQMRSSKGLERWRVMRTDFDNISPDMQESASRASLPSTVQLGVTAATATPAADGSIECTPGCTSSWLGDGVCDTACDVDSCSFDSGDCGTTVLSAMVAPELPAECAKGCPMTWVGDGICDAACDASVCRFDLGDCVVAAKTPAMFTEVSVPCAPGCNEAWLGDGICDVPCDMEACGYDSRDCLSILEEAPRKAWVEHVSACAPGCEQTQLGDGVCNAACDFMACEFDAGDCGVAPRPRMAEIVLFSDCGHGCSHTLLGDGVCDADCNVESCSFDAGDCTVAGSNR